MVRQIKPTEHKVSIGIGIIKQVVQNLSNPLDIIREAISNSCAKQIEATRFRINIYLDGTYGWSFIFEDDGIGMDYTGEEEPEKQGRLDRFLNIAYSGVAGLESDEFGFKGLGSKLMYLSRRLDIETKTKEGKTYKAVIDNAYGDLIEREKPKAPEPVIYEDAPIGDIEHGTIIRVQGYNGGIKYSEYTNPGKLEQYLYYRTLVGFTRTGFREDSFPKIELKAPEILDWEQIDVGFPWIEKEGDHVEGQKIGVIDPPITVSKKDTKGNAVTVVLKGAYALRTSEFGMSDYGIMGSMGVGLTYCWKGIPYFNLDFNLYKPQGFQLYYKFCRFVVECDDVETDIARSRIVSDGIKEPLFTKALREAFREVMNTPDYIDWVKYKRDLKRRELGETLNERKDELQRNDQKWVYLRSKVLHKEPSSENDTRALLWKLEGMGAFPFHYFRTLEHTSQRGIDVIADYQEEDFSEKKLYQAVEVEYMLENYDTHEHSTEQTSLIIAWDSKNREDLVKVKGNWKYIWEYAGDRLEVVLLKYLPGLEVRKRD